MNFTLNTGVSILLSGLPLSVIADQGTWFSPHHMWGSGGWMWGSMFMWLFIFALLLAGVYALIRSSQSTTGGGINRTGTSTALDVLNTRYAKGEINQEEYEIRKKSIQSK